MNDPALEKWYALGMARLTLRIDFEDGRALGPGKVRLLELIRETGSISAAARTMEMSYRRAWLLVNALNQTFEDPVVKTRGGGVDGGGAAVTLFGVEVIACYRTMERDAATTLAQQTSFLEQALAVPRLRSHRETTQPANVMVGASEISLERQATKPPTAARRGTDRRFPREG